MRGRRWTASQRSMPGPACFRQSGSTACFVGVRVSGVVATTRTPSEPACFGGSIGCACSSGLLWLAVERSGQGRCLAWTSLDREPKKHARLGVFAPVRVNGMLRRRARFWGSSDNAHAFRARLLRWVDWLRLLKRALVARGLTIWSRTVSWDGHRWTASQRSMPGSACLRQSGSTACFVGVRVSGVAATTRTPSEPACFGGSIGSPAQAGSCGSRSNDLVKDGVLGWTSLDREPKKHARFRVFAPVRVNGMLRRRARFWGSSDNAHAFRARLLRWVDWLACSSGLLWLAV